MCWCLSVLSGDRKKTKAEVYTERCGLGKVTHNQYGIGNFKTGTEDRDLKYRQLYFQERVLPERDIPGTTKEVKWQEKITDKKIL